MNTLIQIEGIHWGMLGKESRRSKKIKQPPRTNIWDAQNTADKQKLSCF